MSGRTHLATAAEIARLLADRVESLVLELLPAGHRQGHEWRVGSIAGEPGDSLAVHVAAGPKCGIWRDFAAGIGGDLLDLVAGVMRTDTAGAMRWSQRWLGLEEGKAALPQRSKSSAKKAPEPERNYWRRPWSKAVPIASTIAESYLAGRGLRFDDPHGDVLRFAERHGRYNPAGDLEHHPALLALLRDVNTGEACGIKNIYMRPDGADRLRDSMAKKTWGRARNAAVMIDEFESVALGLTICEGPETGIALWLAEQRPVWCCDSAAVLKAFPVLPAIEALTIAADADEAGRDAAEAVAQRWRAAGRQVVIIAPPAGDWADPRRAA